MWDQFSQKGKMILWGWASRLYRCKWSTEAPEYHTVSNPQQLVSEKDWNGKKGKIWSQGKSKTNGERSDCKGIRCFWCKGWGNLACKCPSTPLNGKWGRWQAPPTFPKRSMTRRRGAMDAIKYWQTGNRIWELQPWALSASIVMCKWN